MVKTIIGNLKFPQLMGADGEDGQDDNLDNRIGSDSQPGGNEDDDDNDEDHDDDDEDTKQGKKLAREAARRRRENNKLKRELEELKAEQEAQALSRKSKLEQANHRLKETEDKAVRTAETNERLLLEMAVLKDGKRTWHDSSAVIALLDTSEVDIDPESGNIEGIEEALAELAKAKPFLLKTGGSQRGNGSSGNQPASGGGSKNKTDEQRRSDLRSKWTIG